MGHNFAIKADLKIKYAERQRRRFAWITKTLKANYPDKTKLVSLTHVSNVTGAINDVNKIARAAHDYGALMLVDGAQSVPHLPVDVKDLDVELLAF